MQAFPGKAVEQSAGHVAAVSEQSQAVFPQWGPQSASQLQIVSPQLHVPSPQYADVPPVHAPLALHVSPEVQEFPSSQSTPVLYVTAQADVPSQARVTHGGLEAHETGLPAQAPPEQRSVCVQAFPSSQESLARHSHVPPAAVQ